MKIKGVEQPTLRKAKSKAEIRDTQQQFPAVHGLAKTGRDLAAEQQQQQKPEGAPIQGLPGRVPTLLPYVQDSNHIFQEGNY